jgi:hypothetical protein
VRANLLLFATCRRFVRYISAVMLVSLSAPAIAGPPFVTDDPAPTENGHWEIYAFGSTSHIPGETSGVTGFDLNYGPVEDVQLTATLPLEYTTGAPLTLGNVELGAKVRLLHQDKSGFDLAIFPRVILPTAKGANKVNILLPVWTQKDFGRWSLFGGGGYLIQPGAGNRNSWITAAALSRSVGERGMLGVEVYRQTADIVGGKPYTGVNLGGSYRLSEHWSIIGAAGPGIENAREGGQYNGYAALKFEY